MAAPASSRKPSSRTHEKERHAYERIGPFEIKDEIGRGSFATVYKGYRVVGLRSFSFLSGYSIGSCAVSLTCDLDARTVNQPTVSCGDQGRHPQ